MCEVQCLSLSPSAIVTFCFTHCYSVNHWFSVMHCCFWQLHSFWIELLRMLSLWLSKVTKGLRLLIATFKQSVTWAIIQGVTHCHVGSNGFWKWFGVEIKLFSFVSSSSRAQFVQEKGIWTRPSVLTWGYIKCQILLAVHHDSVSQLDTRQYMWRWFS